MTARALIEGSMDWTPMPAWPAEGRISVAAHTDAMLLSSALGKRAVFVEVGGPISELVKPLRRVYTYARVGVSVGTLGVDPTMLRYAKESRGENLYVFIPKIPSQVSIFLVTTDALVKVQRNVMRDGIVESTGWEVLAKDFDRTLYKYQAPGELVARLKSLGVGPITFIKSNDLDPWTMARGLVKVYGKDHVAALSFQRVCYRDVDWLKIKGQPVAVILHQVFSSFAAMVITDDGPEKIRRKLVMAQMVDDAKSDGG